MVHYPNPVILMESIEKKKELITDSRKLPRLCEVKACRIKYVEI